MARVWGNLHQCIGSSGQEGYSNILQKIWENGERGVLMRFSDSATTYVIFCRKGYTFIIQNFQGKGMKRIMKVGTESEENFFFYVHNFSAFKRWIHTYVLYPSS